MRYISILLLFSLWSCTSTETSYILISKDSNNRIEKWLHIENSKLNIREFYTIAPDSMNYFLQHSSGIVIGGGEDIHPSIYGKNEYVEVCGTFDLFRDSIEILLINYSLDNKIPLLGICRGHQIINASTGGTLIPDIPSFLETDLQHRSKSDSAHVVIVSTTTNNNLLQLGLDTLWVNSHHHQCIDELSPKFNAIAISPDHIVESIQIKDKFSHPYAIGVQWHPESLLDIASMKLARQFIDKSLAN